MSEFPANISAQTYCLTIDATNRWLVAGIIGPPHSQSLSSGAAGATNAADSPITETGVGDWSSGRDAPRESFRQLLPEIEQALGRSGITRPDWIAAARGPGSFTGTRISVGAARNLAQLWDIPIRSVSSLQFYLYSQARRALNDGASPDRAIAVMIDGKQERVYAAHISMRDALAGRKITAVDSAPDRFLTQLYELHPDAIVYVDDRESIAGYARTSAIITERQSDWRDISTPRAVDLRDLCLTNAEDAITTVGWAEFAPEYLRDDAATTKFPGAGA